jgi:hypothetical protein
MTAKGSLVAVLLFVAREEESRSSPWRPWWGGKRLTVRVAVKFSAHPEI